MKKQLPVSITHCQLLFLTAYTFTSAAFSQDFVNINSSKTYTVHNRVHVTNTYGTLSKIIIILPLPQSNTYQEVNSLDTYSGEVLDIPETDDKYIRYTITEDLPAQGESRTYGYDFTISLYNITIDLDVPETIYDYDTSTDLYKWYTGGSGNIVDPDNPDIQAIADPIWDGSPNIIYYAERCYEYVAENFEYLNPGIGLSPLSTVIANGGGDCGNLSSIFVSLLRYEGIPARHVVTMRPDGSAHVWAEFYLEKYGWVPVDVTYKMSNPDLNYFGYYDGNGIVFNREVSLLLDWGEGIYYICPLLQTFLIRYFGDSGCSLDFSQDIGGTQTSVNQSMSIPEHIVLYPAFPNPFNPSTTISYDLDRDVFVKLDVYNSVGQRVCLLSNGVQSEGSHQIHWEPDGLPGGVYIVRMNAGSLTGTEKLIFVK